MKRSVSCLLLVTFLFSLLAFAGCSEKTDQPHTPVPDPTDDNYRVFYEIFVGSFSDSNGDGIGDLRGIIDRMDYLNDGDIASGKSLGVQGIWLSPIYLSPSYHKYDVEDYYQIDPAFGDEETLVELINLCHERNVKVILDLPINHTSLLNDWYIKFRLARVGERTDDPYYDFYSACDLDERLPGHTYNFVQGCGSLSYECNFSYDMPELNFDNPAVREAVLDIAKYYLDLGVDGFRFDAIKYIYYTDTDESVDFWSWYVGELQKIKPDIYTVGECWSGDGETLSYISALNCFNFQIAQAEGRIANAVRYGKMDTFTSYVQNYQSEVLSARSDGMMISFLSNHDMDRISGALTPGSGNAQMAANLYLLSPGSPFLYYGEEIGMKGARGSANTDANRRLAMLWGDGDTVSDPVGSTYDPTKQINGTVKEQTEDEASLYHRYCRLISLRVSYPEIARGTYTALKYGISGFGGFSVRYGDSVIGIFHNTSSEPVTVDLSAAGTEIPFTAIAEIIGNGGATLDGTTLTIGAQTSVLLK